MVCFILCPAVSMCVCECVWACVGVCVQAHCYTKVTNVVASVMYSRALKRREDIKGEESKPACCCSVGNDIIAGVKQPPFTLIYNLPSPSPPLLLLPYSSPHSPYGGVSPYYWERRERAKKDSGWES